VSKLNNSQLTYLLFGHELSEPLGKTLATLVAGFTICSLIPMVTKWGGSVHRFNRLRVGARSMPLLLGLRYNGISYYSKKILRRPRQNCLFAKECDARPVNTAHANDRPNDFTSNLSAYEPPYPNNNESGARLSISLLCSFAISRLTQ